jgi:hypothetical protein
MISQIKNIKTTELIEMYVFYNSRKKYLDKTGKKILKTIEKELEERKEK